MNQHPKKTQIPRLSDLDTGVDPCYMCITFADSMLHSLLSLFLEGVAQTNMLKSTPLLKKTSAYSSEIPPTSNETKLHLGLQMHGQFLGAIPVKKSLHKYLKPDIEIVNVPSCPQNLLGKIYKVMDDKAMYDPFVSPSLLW